MRHVALLIETSRAYGRGLIRGVARYNREHAEWSTYFQPHGLDDPPPAWLKDWQGDGILARIDNRRMAEAVLAAGVPVINLRGTLPELNIPFIGADNESVARLGAEHLLERGLRHFGFCGLARGLHPGLDRRAEHFQQLIQQSGHDCSLFATSRRRRPLSWEEEQERLAHWIQDLPKPVGIMTSNDDRGMQVLDACRRIGALVPDDVAVLGVDNDEYLCGLSIPSLSSIDVNSEEIGYTAAELLDRMMAGHKPPRRLPEIAPRGIVIRKSTDVLAIEDQDVVRAVRFVRENACRGIHATDVLRHVGSSRASLEPRIRQILRRSIHQEIERVRMERVKELLATTNLEIKQVAQRTGFRYVSYLTRVCQRVLGETPARYRARTRSDAVELEGHN